MINPATQEVLARVPMCGADEVDRAVQSAAKAFKTGDRLYAYARQDYAFRDGKFTMKGVVRTDKDFGAGYVYKVLVEEGKSQK
mgnify:CR=1 FL=1